MRLVIGMLVALFVTTGAYAATATVTPQQRMKACAPLTKGMSKTDRSEFMSKCLSKAGHEEAMASRGMTPATGAPVNGEQEPVQAAPDADS